MKITPEIAQRKLWEQKIALDAGKVMEIVRLLKSGKSQYQIYKPPYWEVPLASNNTVYKIKKALEAGELDWMDEDGLYAVLDEMEKASDEDQAEGLARKEWERYQDDGLGKFRLDITQKTEELIKDFVWNITNLVGIGVPEHKARELLEAFDSLSIARESSDTTRQIRNFRGFERYLHLHYLVYLMQKHPNNPYPYYETATALYTRGMLASDDSIKTAGEDILRYEIWRKGQYIDSYNKSLKRYKRTPKRNRELSDQIKGLLSRGDDDEQQKT